ncbi:unnamed protein product [Rotaria magnacalcarata]|uniref:Uncharacterized protein n=1 Tax=Rotaria magnacalcarata TaxID=392030 RepID=A0A8S2KWQ6_9BILA|nr:unnamed protein product [Rotaria magnacalcarata]
MAVNSGRRVNPDQSVCGACRSRSCIVCPIVDSTSMRVLSDEQQTMIFLSRSTWVLKGARCCSNHLCKGYLSYEARQSVKQSKVNDILLNRHNVEKLIDNFRLALKHAGSLDFDELGALDNETYKTITGLDRDHFNDLLDKLSTMRNSRLRSVRVALAIFLEKIRLALSNRVLACFRDTVNILNRLDLQIFIPGFLHNKKQLPADEANRTRFFTKNRWVIESVNGKIKQWKFMTQIIQSSTLRCERHREWQRNCNEDVLTTENRLQERLAKHTGTTSLHWSKHNAVNFQFPPLIEENIRDLIFGSCQIRVAKSYIIEQIRQSQTNEKEMEFIVELCNEHDDLVRARFQSRHSNNKTHIATVQFDHHKQQPIDAWYCTCSAAARESACALT